jgi:hypothetical protein
LLSFPYFQNAAIWDDSLTLIWDANAKELSQQIKEQEQKQHRVSVAARQKSM